MRIVHVEGYFHSNAGYQINILSKYLASFGHEQFILTAEIDKIPDELTKFFGRDNIEKSDCYFEKEHNIKIKRLPLRAYISGREIFGPELEQTIEKLQPDVVFVHGNDSYAGIKLILKSGKKQKYCLVTDSHMLSIASKNTFSSWFQLWYRFFVTPKIIKNKIVVIRTQNDNYVQEKLGIPLKQAPWISVGTDMNVFYPNKKIKEVFREKYNLSPNAFVVVYTGKLDESKGGLLLAETFKEKFKSSKDIVLLCVGNTIGDYGKQVEEIFLKSKNRIIKIDTQPYLELAKFYQAADLSIFPKQSSLSFYDAQACGLPVISENKSINVERLAHGNGKNFESNNVEDIRSKIDYFANLSFCNYTKYSENAMKYVQNNFNYETIAKEYERVIIEEWETYNNLKLRTN